MKKVVFSISKYGKTENKQTGVGYLTDNDLVIASISSKTHKPYIKVFADCVKYCHKVVGKNDEYKGSYYEICEIDGKEIEVNYNIWFKETK